MSLVERIIARAAAERASDIHLEPMKNSLRVRFRVDGTFHEVAHLLLAPAILARIKVLSGMDITDHRLPQDGRFSATMSGRGLDVRASEAQLFEAARHAGMVPLRDACLARVRDGDTTFEEVLRVTMAGREEEAHE